ncbi:aspartyl protease domain-containing protein [Sarocladium implicatum]|nr:aspartyl protease domain-containing protein [Sarocladium implicatum]
MTVETLRESIRAEANIPSDAQHIYLNGRLLSDDTQTMEQLQVGDGEVLAVHVRSTRGSGPGAQMAQPPATQQQQPQQHSYGGSRRGGAQDPETVRLQIMANPTLRQQLARQYPELAAAVDNPAQFARVFEESQNRDQRERLERQREIERLNEDPNDPQSQAEIAERIRMDNVMQNLQNALEHNPEVFGRVHMLYVNVEVNGHKVKALVDSGAQATIMSPKCAEDCGIMRLVDKRFAGVAKGVGTANIIGRVHTAQIKIGTLFLPCSFTVMEGKTVEMLLGLDMLKRYQASLDLGRDKLIIQDTEIPFLGEAEIPKDEEVVVQEPTLPGPSGTQIGQRTGAVLPPGASSGQELSGAQSTPQASQPDVQPTPASQSSASPATPSQVNVTPAHVESLVAMGATRAQAIQALQAAEDNVDVAAGIIFF